MTASLYVDQHVPSAITRGLRNRSIDVLTADEDGLADRPDKELLARAMVLGRIIFTQDVDFLSLAAHYSTTGQTFTTVVYAHQLRITIGQAIADLELICQSLEPEELLNQVIYLPL